MSEGLYVVLAALLVVSYLLLTASTRAERARAWRERRIHRVERRARADMDHIVGQLTAAIDAAERQAGERRP